MSSIAVVIATYNEAETIGGLLACLAPLPVFVVDDDSPDGTAYIARHYDNAIVISRTNERGIATAYRRGFEEALDYGYDYIVQMDAGDTHDPLDIQALIKNRHDYDLIIASRFSGRHKFAGYRTAISLTAAAMMRMAGIGVTDATTGYRCWSADLLRKVIATPFDASGFAFQLEALFRACSFGAKIGEIGVSYKLTNSSFRASMLVEALKIYMRHAL